MASCTTMRRAQLGRPRPSVLKGSISHPATGCRTLSLGPNGRGGYHSRWRHLAAQNHLAFPVGPGLPPAPSACIGRSTSLFVGLLVGTPSWIDRWPSGKRLGSAKRDIRPVRRIHESNLSKSRVEGDRDVFEPQQGFPSSTHLVRSRLISQVRGRIAAADAARRYAKAPG